MSTLNAMEAVSNGHMINRILDEWSFHMKFTERAEGTQTPVNTNQSYL